MLVMISVPDGPYLESFDANSLTVFEHIIQELSTNTNTQVVVKRIPDVMTDLASISQRHISMTAIEFAENHKQRWRQHASLYRPFNATTIASHTANGEAEQEEYKLLLELGREGRTILREQLHSSMDSYGIDAWITPGSITGVATAGLGSTGDPGAQVPFSHAGLPTIVLPAGLVPSNDGAAALLPYGVQLAGRFGGDERLLGSAAVIETALTDMELTARSVAHGRCAS
jgi:Asp-tRNA(Asn)/Glu-tRNA(Gln) amidotransferase A subunit family amidase